MVDKVEPLLTTALRLAAEHGAVDNELLSHHFPGIGQQSLSWARIRLCERGLLEPLSPKRYKITQRGREIAAQDIPITLAFLRQLAQGNSDDDDRRATALEQKEDADVANTAEIEWSPAAEASSFSLNDALRDLFIDRNALQDILGLWRIKKNLILQGAPGVGKTFLGTRLGYLLMGRKDNARLRMIQFHQAYAYEDFVQGYRPSELGGFERKDGVFFNFCRLAESDPDRSYVFIIDEINRGNLSKILGEIMMLIEADKPGVRGSADLLACRGAGLRRPAQPLPAGIDEYR